MLVLSRKSQEAVVVGGTDGFESMLKVTVLDIRRGTVRLGFDIDPSVPVHRWEVWERIRAADFRPPNAAATSDSPHVSWIEPGRPMESVHPADSGPRKYGILVVDDEHSVRSVLHHAMEKQGFAVWLAANGQEALEVYKLHGDIIDVVLLDLRMPILDGPQTLAALQEIKPGICCCLMSGDLGRDGEAKLGTLGAAALFRKPFSPPEVGRLLWKLAATADARPAPA